MGFIANGTHDKKLNENGWRTMDSCPEYTDVYLKCSLMMDEFVVIGQVGGGNRIKSDGDPDVFFRSAVLFWKPLQEERTSEAFKIDVDAYCDHCGNFTPTAETINMTTIGDRLPRHIHVISCTDRDRCRALSNYHKALQNDREEETVG